MDDQEEESGTNSKTFTLQCALEQKKKFAFTLQNDTTQNYSIVRVKLILPPDIKAFKKSRYVGDLEAGKGKTRDFKITPKLEGSYTINARITSDKGLIASVPIVVQISKEDPGIEELIYHITKSTVKKAPIQTYATLKLKNGGKSLICDANTEYEFDIIVENTSPHNYTLVNIRLVGSPQIKILKKTNFIGNLESGASKTRIFKIEPKTDGIFNLTAIATSNEGDLTNLPFDIYVGEKYASQAPKGGEEERVAKEEVSEKKCPHCGALMEKDAKFCPNCGADLTKVKDKPQKESETKICRFCGKEIPKEAKFCAECGKKLI